MAARGPLRRWKRFFSVFDTIDAAITAVGNSSGGDEVGCAEVLRQTKAEVVQLLCDVPEDGDAEYLCVILDNVMAEYLVTLETAPVTPSALMSTGLAKAVGALLEHESEQIRGLARDAVGRWKAAVVSHVAEARALAEKLRKLSEETPVVSEKKKSNLPAAKVSTQQQLPKKSAPVVNEVSSDKMTTKRVPAIVGNGGRDHAGAGRLDAPKRKVQAGYLDREAEDAKRQRKMEAPKLVEQGQQQSAKISAAPLLKKSAPVAGMTAMDKMEATRTKLRVSYQHVEDAKRQHKIIVIEAPKMAKQQFRKVDQRQRPRPLPFLKKGAPGVGVGRASTATMDAKLLPKIHPVIGSQARCAAASTAAVRRSLVPSFCRV